MPSHFESAKGAYIIKDYDKNKPKKGVIIVRGTSVINELCKILPELISNGPNIKIVAALFGHYIIRKVKNIKIQ